MTTDNTQELDELLDRLMQYSYDYGSRKIPTSEDPPLIIARQAKQAILELIRTEKLKLLAEVRERVVGEDDNDLSGAHNELNHKFVGCVECQKNQLRADQRTVLTKMEAEL